MNAAYQSQVRVIEPQGTVRVIPATDDLVTGEKLFKDSKKAIAEGDLVAWEQDRVDFIKLELRELDEKLAQVATAAKQSIAGDVYDDMSLQIASEMDILQTELDQLKLKQHEAKMIERNLDWLREELKSIEFFDPEKENPTFRDDIYRRLVKRGDVYKGGLIVYELTIGITRKTDKNNLRAWNYSENSMEA